jgi:hypothetical protein
MASLSLVILGYEAFTECPVIGIVRRNNPVFGRPTITHCEDNTVRFKLGQNILGRAFAKPGNGRQMPDAREAWGFVFVHPEIDFR